MTMKSDHPKFKFTGLVMIALQRIRELFQFYKRNFDAPYPTFIKRKTLVSHAVPAGNWIETGTYVGSTSKYLSQKFPRITTIEPSEHFYELSNSRLSKVKNIRTIFGSSEEEFEKAIELESCKLNVWLDGHFSDGGTFLGEAVSPVMQELSVISAHKHRFESIVVFVDDVRLFSRSVGMETDYPPITFLIDWANQNGFNWEIQNDIFIASLKP
jgi:hypothetical protein